MCEFLVGDKPCSEPATHRKRTTITGTLKGNAYSWAPPPEYFCARHAEMKIRYANCNPSNIHSEFEFINDQTNL